MSTNIPASSGWNLRLLGGLVAEQGGVSITRFRTHKAAALLAYLALFPGRTPTREELADLFWPEADAESGRTSLRSALASLRRQLEPPGVPTGGVISTPGRDTVRLEAASVTVDVARFEALLKSAARQPATESEEKVRLLTEAVALYSGPLLPGFYETWALSERDRLAEACLRALSELTALHERAGRFDAAVEYARRAISADPLREEAHADVIRLLVARGEATVAQRHYQQMAKLFEEQMGAEPSPALRRLLEGPVRVPQPKAEQPLEPLPEPLTVAIPAPKAIATPIHLPLTLTRFFGREREIEALLERIQSPHVRLMTITGPGGSGKTRFAVECARKLAPQFPGGVWFIPLGDLLDPDRVGEVIADALTLPRGRADLPVVEQISLAVRRAGGPVLLILDNFEQLVDAADDDGIPGYDENSGPDAIRRLLLDAPDLKCLVTSRQCLLLEGEQELSLLPLLAPDPAAFTGRVPVPLDREALLGYPSIQLFVARAQAARPDFQLTERNAEAVARLCARLEGMPLAIELAAAWAQTLTPAQMLERLERGAGLLVSRRRDVPGRHATLRAAIAWSYELLPEELRHFFIRLSVFRGGWTLHAAEAVTGEVRTLEFLTELRDRSLLVIEEQETRDQDDTGELRFRMLETLREFAREQEVESNAPDAARISRRHLEHFLALATEAAAGGPGGVEGIRQLAREQENLRAALAWSLDDTDDPERVRQGLRLAGALIWFWLVRGFWSEGLQTLSRALKASTIAHGPEPDDTAILALRAKALRGAGWLASRNHDTAKAVAFAEEGLALARRVGDPGVAAFCLSTLGLSAQHNHSSDLALNLLNEAVAAARTSGKPYILGHCLCCLGHALIPQLEWEAARACFEEGLATLQGHGERYGIAEAQRALGHLFLNLGLRDRARDTIEEAIATYRDLGDLGTVGLCTMMLGFIAFDDGDDRGARILFEAAMLRCREGGDRFGAAHALHNRAYTYLNESRWDEARADFVESIGLFRDLGYNGDVAMSLEGFAHLAARQGQAERSVRLWAAAEVLRTRLNAPLPEIHRVRRDADRALAVAAVGEARVAAALTSGANLTAEMAIAYAQGGGPGNAGFPRRISSL